MSITYNNPDEVVKVKHILSLSTFTDKTGATCQLTYSGDGDFFVEKTDVEAGLSCQFGYFNGKILYVPTYGNTTPTVPMTFKVGFTKTENYKTCSVDITVTT